MSHCKLETVTLHFNQLKLSLKKSDFGIIVVLIDFLVVLVYIWFIYFLDRNQHQFANAYKDKTLQMNDFTIEL